MEAKGDSIEAHKYLLSYVHSEEFITQILAILRKKKKKKKKPWSIQVVMITLLSKCSSFQWK